MSETAQWARGRGTFSRWGQSYLVLSFCRMLHTLEAGTIVSKREAGEWALRRLDPRWHDLIGSALADRADSWARVHHAASPPAVAETLAFIDAATR